MYSEHPSEFPLEKLPVMIDPTLLIALLLLLALVGLGAFLLGFGVFADRSRERREEEARARILAHIRFAAQTAVNARADEVHAKGAALRNAIREAVGPVIDLGQGAGSPYRALSDALEGKPAKPPQTPAAKVSAQSGETGTGGQINIGNAAVFVSGPDSAPRSVEMPAESPVPRIRAAVQELADYWSEAARDRELRLAQDALIRTTVKAPDPDDLHAQH